MDSFDELMRKIGYVPEEEYTPDMEVKETTTIVENEEPKADIEVQKQEPEQVDNNSVDNKAEEEKGFNFFSELKNKTGREFKDESEIKTFFENISNIEKEISERKEKDGYYTELETNFKSIVENFHPSKIYGSEEAWKKAETAKQIGGNKNQYVVNELINKDISKIDNLKMAALNGIFNAPDISEEDGKRSILRKLGVDFKQYEEDNDKPFDINNPDLTNDQKTDLAIMASEARDKFTKIINEVKLPEFPNYIESVQNKVKERESSLKKLEEDWDKVSKRMIENPMKLTFFEKDKTGKDKLDFEFNMDKGFVKEAVDLIKKDAVLRNLPATEENIKAQEELLKMYHSYKNMKQIAVAYAQEKVAEIQGKMDDDIHNNQPINRNEKPTNPKEKTQQDLINDEARSFLIEQGLL